MMDNLTAFFGLKVVLGDNDGQSYYFDVVFHVSQERDMSALFQIRLCYLMLDEIANSLIINADVLSIVFKPYS